MNETILLLIPVGIAIGLLLGSVGGGGSLIAVPALIYLGDQSVRGAQAGALVVVIAAAAFGVAAYLRADDVRWRAGLAFGAAAGVSSLLGSLVSRRLDPDLLLLAFVPVMVAGALAMLRGRTGVVSSFRPWRYGVSAASVARVVGLGFAVGWLIGLFGVGGGFVIVPALVLVLGFDMTEAVGTSLLVIIMGALVAFAERLGAGGIDWPVTVAFAGSAVAGVIAGRRLASRIESRTLTVAFAALVILVAVYTGADAVGGLLDDV